MVFCLIKFWKDFIDYNDMNSVNTNLFLTLSNSDASLALGKSGSSTNSLSSLASSSKQLVELAAEQKFVNYHLCAFHYQLIRMLYLIIKFNMKPVKPYSFFDTKVRCLHYNHYFLSILFGFLLEKCLVVLELFDVRNLI